MGALQRQSRAYAVNCWPFGERVCAAKRVLILQLTTPDAAHVAVLIGLSSSMCSGRKSCAITTARRLGEFLGDERIKVRCTRRCEGCIKCQHDYAETACRTALCSRI